jgi:hypothetical protein
MKNNYIKDYGVFVLVYILFISILILKFGYTSQAFMITILLIGYLYYNTYYSSVNELVNNTSDTFNNVVNGNLMLNTNKFNSIKEENIELNNDLDRNLSVEKNVITNIPSISKLIVIKKKIYDFINEYIPVESRADLQVEQQNNREIANIGFNNLINRYFKITELLINMNSEELNYYQQLKNIEKEILTLIHNSVFLNHKADISAGKLINELKTIFTNIQKELSYFINNKSTHHQKEFIPTISEFTAANNYEDNILF